LSNLYEKIVNANPDYNVENLVLPKDIGNPDPDSPGQKILADALRGGGGRATTTVADLYQAFLNTPLRAEWEWRPRGSGYSANRYGILDGSKLYGECLHYAYALWLLARAPWPFGLGCTHTQVKTHSYKGEKNEGFVSNHNGVFLKLEKNVHPANGSPTHLYYWENHKTVSFNNVFYDICYGTTYNTEPLMAGYTLTGIFTDINGPSGTLFAEKAKRNDGLYFWFRRIQPSDGIANDKRSYIGPVDETTFDNMVSRMKGLVVK